MRSFAFVLPERHARLLYARPLPSSTARPPVREGEGVFIPDEVPAVQKTLYSGEMAGILKSHGGVVLLRAKALADFDAWRASQRERQANPIEPALDRTGSFRAEDGVGAEI